MKMWMTTAEVRVQPGDMPSGDVLGFMKVAMWACSEADFIGQVHAYLTKYRWELLSYENTTVVDPDMDYEDEVNDVIDTIGQDESCVGLGTYYSYKPE
jgi:hypothetical protein